MRWFIALAFLASACAPEADADGRSGANDAQGANALADAPLTSDNAQSGEVVEGDTRKTEDDGLAANVDPQVARLAGDWELWENRGDDSLMCPAKLTKNRTIGGYVITVSEKCLKPFKAGDLTEVAAWFVAEADGHIVLIDATRRVLQRLKPSDNPRYYGNSDFYLIRSEMPE